MKNTKLLLVFCVFALVAAGAFGGAGQQSAETQGGSNTVSLTGFSVYTPVAVPNSANTYADHLVWKAIEEKYGIHVDWQTVPTGSNNDWIIQLGLIMASQDLPDFFSRINPQLAEEYGRQGALMSLTEIIDTKIPNLKTIMNENKVVQGMMTSADGKIYFVPRLLLDPRTRHFNGLMIREDWVREAGMSMPSSTDDFYNVLKGVQQLVQTKTGQNNTPFIGDYRVLIWAFGVGSRGTNQENDFFVENGQIKYGPTDPRYRTALEYLHKLHSEGLILNHNNVEDVRMQGIVGETAASTYGSWAGQLTTYNKLLSAAGKNPGLRGIAPLRGPTGERNDLGHHTELDLTCGGAISSTTKKADDVARLFDILYSKEGNIMVDFGVEGDTYTMVNGVPTYTNKVLNDPTISVLNYMNAYVSNVSIIPAELLVEHYLPTLSPEGVEGNRITSEANNRDKKPPTLRFSDAEIREVQALRQDIDVYVDENRDKFVNGEMSFNQWNTFQAGLQQMRVSRLVELYNAAYQRFLAASK